jgi:hypothetical protein
MTAVALWAVLTQVPVVLVMTHAALLRHFHRARRLVWQAAHCNLACAPSSGKCACLA